MSETAAPDETGFDYVVTAEFGDYAVGQVLPDHPGDDHAHRVVRRAKPSDLPALAAPEPASQES